MVVQKFLGGLNHRLSLSKPYCDVVAPTMR